MTRYIILVETPIGWDCTDLVYRNRHACECDKEQLECLHPDKTYTIGNIDCNDIALECGA